MLRRSRLTLPLLAALSALLGSIIPVALAVVVAVVVALTVDSLVARAEQARLTHLADQVVAFASDERRPRPLSNAGGRQWLRLVTALNDVATVLRDRFDALRAEQERVERLLDALPTAVLLFGADGLVYANPAAVEMFDLAEFDGLTPLRALGVTALAQAIVEATETGQPVSVNVRRDDRELMGRVTGIGTSETAVIVTDLTSLQRVEAMRRDFVANASHELKTPVTGIRALADSLHLAMERDPDRARVMVERIQLEATRLSQLVRDLLDLARLEEGADDRVRQAVDLGPLCAQQIERLSVVAEQQEVQVFMSGDGGATVIGIPEDLKLIVGNLIHNAVQYNHPGGVVTVSVGRLGTSAVIEVADNGIGIPESDQERIFERFYRVDKARSRAAGGTGLGLSLIRHAVERHAGSITVTSVLGEGSTFTIELPVDGGVS